MPYPPQGAGLGDMPKTVYDSDRNGRIEKDALEITLNKLLLGAGSGVDPTEIAIGAGAGEVATGDHTHTLVAEAESMSKTGLGSGFTSYGYYSRAGLSAGATYDFITKTDTFSALSLALAAFGSSVLAESTESIKFQLLMGGVQVAETNYVGTGNSFFTLVGNRALSGSQICKITIHNYNVASKYLQHYMAAANSNYSHSHLAVGSVKV